MCAQCKLGLQSFRIQLEEQTERNEDDHRGYSTARPDRARLTGPCSSDDHDDPLLSSSWPSPCYRCSIDAPPEAMGKEKIQCIGYISSKNQATANHTLLPPDFPIHPILASILSSE